MKKTLLALSLLGASLNTFAADTAFEGPYVGASLNFVNLENDIEVLGTKLSFDNDGTNIGLGLNLGYGASFNDFYLAVEAGLSTGNGKSKSEYNGVEITVEGQQGWNISILPGYLVDNSTLIYGRLGLGSIQGKVSALELSDTDDIDTTVLGLGVQKSFSETLSARVELSQTSFDETINNVDYSGTATAVSFGIQSKF
jgi:hypothetical protein